MRKLLLFTLSLLVSGSVAMAQNKIETKWHCSKPTGQQLEVGDVPDHVYWIGQGTCEATSSSGDLKDKSGNFTEFHDQWKAFFNFHGYFNETRKMETRFTTPTKEPAHRTQANRSQISGRSSEAAGKLRVSRVPGRALEK